MMANAACLAGLAVFLLAGWLAGELRFLAPYKATIFREYGMHIGAGTLLVFLNLAAAFYAIGRSLFLRDTGRKLTHIDRQLSTPDGAHPDLRAHLTMSSR